MTWAVENWLRRIFQLLKCVCAKQRGWKYLSTQSFLKSFSLSKFLYKYLSLSLSLSYFLHKYLSIQSLSLQLFIQISLPLISLLSPTFYTKYLPSISLPPGFCTNISLLSPAFYTCISPINPSPSYQSWPQPLCHLSKGHPLY